MNFIRNIFGGKSRSQLEEVVEEVKPIFQSQEGRSEIVKSILYSEFPLVLAEYVFEIKEGHCVYPLNLTDERLNFLKKMVLQGINEEILKQYLRYSHSAVVVNSSRNPIFHTHPRYPQELYLSAGEPNFSPTDKKVAKKYPVGLIEYCVLGSQDNPIKILSRLSLCYKGHIMPFSTIDIHLNPDGSYSSNDGEVEQTGRIPIFAFVTEKVVDNFLKSYISDELIRYVMQHAVKKV